MVFLLPHKKLSVISTVFHLGKQLRSIIYIHFGKDIDNSNTK